MLSSSFCLLFVSLGPWLIKRLARESEYVREWERARGVVSAYVGHVSRFGFVWYFWWLGCRLFVGVCAHWVPILPMSKRDFSLFICFALVSRDLLDGCVRAHPPLSPARRVPACVWKPSVGG